MEYNTTDSTNSDWFPNDIFSQLEKAILDTNLITTQSMYDSFLNLLKTRFFEWNVRQISILVELLKKGSSYGVKEAQSAFIDEIFEIVPENVLKIILRTNLEVLREVGCEKYSKIFSESEIIEIHSGFICKNTLTVRQQIEVLGMLRDYSPESYLRLTMDLVCLRTIAKSKIQMSVLLQQLLDKFLFFVNDEYPRGYGYSRRYIHSLDADKYMTEHEELLSSYKQDLQDMILAESDPESGIILAELLVTIFPRDAQKVFLSMLFSKIYFIRHKVKILKIMRSHYSYRNQKQYDSKISRWKMESNFGITRKMFQLHSVTNSTKLKAELEECILAVTYGATDLTIVLSFLENRVNHSTRRIALKILSWSPSGISNDSLLEYYYFKELDSDEDISLLLDIFSHSAEEIIVDFYWDILINGAEEFHSRIIDKLILITPLNTLLYQLTDKIPLSERNIANCVKHYTKQNADIHSTPDLLLKLIPYGKDSDARLLMGKLLVKHHCINHNLSLVSELMASLQASTGFHGYYNLLFPQLNSTNTIEIINGFRKNPKILNLFLQRLSKEPIENTFWYKNEEVQKFIDEISEVNETKI